MKEEQFESLRESIQGDDPLARLSTYGDILEGIVDYIVTSKKNNSDISYLLESIKDQKRIYDCAEKLYERIQGESIDKIDAELKLNELKDACCCYKKFVDEFEKNEKKNVEIGSNFIE